MRKQSHKLVESSVRTRFAPSPTGTPESIHLGFIIRALWNYAYAHKNNGQFILRIEDTDQKRSRRDTEEAIYAVLKKFGIEWDEGPDIGGQYGPYRQSERLHLYKEAALKLIDKGYAYYDFDSIVREKEEIKEGYNSQEKLAELKIRPKARLMPAKDVLRRLEAGEPYVVRVKIPEHKVFEYEDWILKKKIMFQAKEVPDMILLKSDGFPTYHLAVVVDDIAMKISHVFRGQEWISSTPIHLYIYEGLQKPVPEIGHFSVILDPRTNKKFSKRDVSALFGVDTWLKKGYLPDAILNYLMLLGWAPKDNKEIFTLGEFVEVFDQSGVQKANPTFDTTKLDWFNGHYIRLQLDEELSDMIFKFFGGKYSKDKISQIVPLIKDRIKNLSEFESIAGFLFLRPRPLRITDKYITHIKVASDSLSDVNTWNKENVDAALVGAVQINNFKTGDFFMDLRGAITGSRFTPPINDSIVILGREETLERLKQVSHRV